MVIFYMPWQKKGVREQRCQELENLKPTPDTCYIASNAASILID
jgi:hypothetical protein